MIRHCWVALLLLAACAHTPSPPRAKILVCPAAGGASWSELRSPHFKLRTDLPRDQAQAVILDLEERWARTGAVVDLVLPSGPPPGETDVVLFARTEDFAAIAPGIGGAFVRTDDRGVPLIVVGPTTEKHPLPAVLQHELVHRFVWRRASRIPLWLDQGMAELFASLTWKDGKLEIGAIVPGRGVKSDDLPRLPTLERVVLDGAYYASDWYYDTAIGWAFLHWQLTGSPEQRERVRQFGADLAKRRDDRAAFEERFGKPAALEPAFAQYLRKLAAGTVTLQLLPDPATASAPPTIAERTLDEAELHALWSFFDSRGGVQLEEMRAHAADSALLHFSLAWAAERRNDQVTADEELARAIALDPKEPRWTRERTITRAQRLLRAQPSRAELAAFEPELAAALRDSDDPHLLNEAAWFYGHAGKTAVGLPLARRAIAARPENGDFLDTLALLLYQSGQRAEALATQEEALSRYGDGARLTPGIRERLALYRESAH